MTQLCLTCVGVWLGLGRRETERNTCLQGWREEELASCTGSRCGIEWRLQRLARMEEFPLTYFVVVRYNCARSDSKFDFYLSSPAKLRPIQMYWISEQDTEPNKVGSFGSAGYKDTVPLRENGKFCISEPDTEPNCVGSFGSARYTRRYVATLLTGNTHPVLNLWSLVMSETVNLFLRCVFFKNRKS